MTLDLALFEHLLAATPDAVLLVDKAGLILQANRAVKRIFGHDPAAILGQPIEVLVPMGQRDAHRHHHDDFVQTSQRRAMGSGMVVQGLRADGTTVPLDVQLAPLHHNGQAVTIAVARDIRHIVRLQDELAQHAARLEESLALSEQQRQQLEQLDADKNQLLGMTAHDLRNPLTALGVFTDLLESGALGNVSDTHRPLVRRISRSVDYMAHLVNQMLDWSAVQEGHLTLHRTEIQLAELMEGAIEVETLAAQQSQITISAQDINAGITAFIDGPKLEQIIHNLVSNGVRHSQPGDTIEVSLTRSADPTLSAYVLRVCDHGSGIRTNQRAHIFEPFARGPDSKGTGVGLGLAIVNQIVRAHGGAITLEDTPGGGATFVVTLPDVSA